MDIQYLLWLQDFRAAIGDALTPFMEWASSFATTYLILLPVFYYWNRDKKKGLFTLVSYCLCMFLTPVIKLTACVYRPWIRDSRILPAGDSITTATGYSFPSGHTTTCAPLAAGTALNIKNDRRWTWLSVILIIYILITGFSRNYLGVHTPQDVVVALIISALCLFVTAKLFGYLDKHPEKEDWFLLGGFVICWLAIVYITFKPYPTDLNAEGKLIVDPQKMMNDGYGDIGKVIGFIAARWIEKRRVRFEPLKNKGWKGILICAAGLIPMILLKQFFSPVIVGWLGSHWGKLVFSVIYTSYYILLFPIVLKIFGKKMKDKSAVDETGDVSQINPYGRNRRIEEKQ